MASLPQAAWREFHIRLANAGREADISRMTSDLRRTPLLLAVILVAVVAGIVLLRPRSGTTADSGGSDEARTVEERIAALRTRLSDLVVVQDTFHRHYGVYGRHVDQMRFEVAPDMTIEIIAHSAQGWAAQGLVRGSDRLCAIFVGDSADWAFPPANRPGVPSCTP